VKLGVSTVLDLDLDFLFGPSCVVHLRGALLLVIAATTKQATTSTTTLFLLFTSSVVRLLQQ
jgi:hypothetical protein